MAMGALFFLAFAYFAVGQASVSRNQAQTAADAAALAAARADRDAVRDAFLAALDSGDVDALTNLLKDVDWHDGAACSAAATYAADNSAEIPAGNCVRAVDGVGYTVTVKSRKSVGTSVVDGTEKIFAKATATAVVEPRCVMGPDQGPSPSTGGPSESPSAGTAGPTPGAGGLQPSRTFGFVCDDHELTLDPSSADFRLDLSTFYAVHLSR